MKNHLNANSANNIAKVSKSRETKLDKIYRVIIEMSSNGFNHFQYDVSDEINVFKKNRKGRVSFKLTKKEENTLIKNGFNLKIDKHDVKHGIDSQREIHW